MEKIGQTSLAAMSGGLPPPRPVRWSLARKVSLALISILLFTLLVAGFFAYFKFESVYSSQVQSRYSFMVFTIKKRVEDSLNLGLSLRQLRQVQDILEHEKQRDAQVLAVEVYDHRGEVLFDTDRGAIGGKVSDALVEAARGNPSQAFGLADEDTLIVGLPLVNALGKVEGGVVLRYSAVYVEQGVGGLLLELAKAVGVYLAIFAVVALAGLYLLFGRVGRKLAGMEHALTEVLSVGGHAVPEAGGGEFEEHFAEFVDKTREAIDHIRDATDEVGRLDRLA
ncbi:hypothetical protein [Magnetospirillum sp. SS-4]|uniref:hypothetical protein n=1 Tax=Magnetospirillum sp. SS-4 TaxID=2681465 RepID=UPI0013832AFC|nr:hypothetical protein [Magnetospirillum sp. SS-4]CAA7627485.1 conserved hypothetical protein [Magnetospirillum sp. SS-4]